MSSISERNSSSATSNNDFPRTRRVSTEAKASVMTTELMAYVLMASVLVVIGVLVASAITDTSDFGSPDAWFYVSLLTIGYMISRCLAKAGSRDFL